MEPPFAVICLAGPSADETRRLNDLLESLFFWEPRTPLVLLVDDPRAGRDLAAAAPAPPEGRLIVMPNPLAGVGHYWDRGCAGMAAGLAHLSRIPGIEFVLKVDTDSLVVAPFSERVAGAIRRNPAAGQIGAYTAGSRGERWYSRGWLHPMGRLSLPVRAWRKPAFPGFWLESALRGRARRVRAYACAARAQGYRAGEHILGGGNVISPTALSRMADRGLLDEPRFWRGRMVVEDLLLSMYVRAVGLELLDDSGEGGVFGVAGRGLPHAPLEILRRRHAVVHSVKNDPKFPEEGVLAFFRERRGNPSRPHLGCWDTAEGR